MPGTDNPNRSEGQSGAQSPPSLLETQIDQQIEHAIKQHYETEHKRKKFRNAWRSASPITKGSFYMTAGIAAATIVYALVAIFQLVSMRTTLGVMKTSSDKSSQQMWSAIDNINWMARSMDLSQKSAQQAIEANQSLSDEDRRPWVSLLRIDCTGCSATQEFSKTSHSVTQWFESAGISAVIVNTGRTPALHMDADATMEVLTAGEGIPTWDSLIARQKKLVKEHPNLPPVNVQPKFAALGPNGVQVIEVSTTKERWGREFFASPSEKHIMWIVGKITYRDTTPNSVTHTTTFCLFNEAWDGTFVFCPTGNDMN